MGDLVMALAAIVFFVICVGYVSLCDRIIGPDDSGEPSPTAGEQAEATR